jgi:peptide chain release factor subunit 1
MRLPEAPETQVAVGDSPLVEPLTRIAAERWAVLLLSRSEGRLFRGSRSRLREIRSIADDVHQQHSQGGWSQARYQRSVEEEVHRHIDRALAELQASFRRAPFDHLLIAAPEDAWTLAQSRLDDELRRRLAGRFSCDASDATADDVLEAAREAMVEAEVRQERELLDRLSDALGMDGPASQSLPDVLDALVQRKVDALLLDETFEAPGAVCTQCGWLGADGDRCPLDGSELEQHEDIVEPAVEAAVLQSARTVYVRHHPDLQPLGGIASLNRF